MVDTICFLGASRSLVRHRHPDIEELGGVLEYHALSRGLVDALQQVAKLTLQVGSPDALRMGVVTAPEGRFDQASGGDVQQLRANRVVLEGEYDVALEILARQKAQLDRIAALGGTHPARVVLATDAHLAVHPVEEEGRPADPRLRKAELQRGMALEHAGEDQVGDWERDGHGN